MNAVLRPKWFKQLSLNNAAIVMCIWTLYTVFDEVFPTVIYGTSSFCQFFSTALSLPLGTTTKTLQSHQYYYI